MIIPESSQDTIAIVFEGYIIAILIGFGPNPILFIIRIFYSIPVSVVKSNKRMNRCLIESCCIEQCIGIIDILVDIRCYHLPAHADIDS